MARIGGAVGLRRISAGTYSAQAASTRAARQNLKSAIAAVQRVLEKVENATPEGLRYAVQPIFDRSQELVPVDTGKLRDSGYIEVTSTARGSRVVVGYAKAGDPHYAVYVHENLYAKHLPPTGARFLYGAFEELGDQVAPRLAEYLAGEVQKEAK
jgi:hypothetical protein